MTFRTTSIISGLRYALFAACILLGWKSKAQTNLALGKSVTSSSVFNSTTYPNANLTDGNINTFAHTDNSAVAPNAGEYFTIDLGSDQIIETVKIVNRLGVCCGDRARRFMLITWPSAAAGVTGLGNNPTTYLDDSRFNRLGYTDPSTAGSTPALGTIVGASGSNLGPAYDSLTLNVGIHKARYVMILSLQDDYLNLAEVKVFAGPPPIRGFFNGGFESALSTGGFPASTYSQLSESIVPGWSTTEVVAMYGSATTATPEINLASTDPTGGGRIEVWHSGFGSVSSYEGTYFAELNAFTNGELSQQPICVQPGETFNWSFAHRGRNGVDVMRLRINDIDVAEFSDNNATGGTHTSSVLTSATTTITGSDATTASGWTRHYGTWTNTSASSQTVQFSFRAVSATGGAGAGNFLDAVSIDNLSATVSFNKATAIGTENQATSNLPMIWVNGIVSTPQTVQLNITGGTATRDSDYVTPTTTSGAITLTIPIGTYDGTDGTGISLAPYINVLRDNNNGEPDETITMLLQTPSSGLRIATSSDCIIVPASHTYTITDFVSLPIKLQSFKGQAIDCSTQLEWVSSSEARSDLYSIQRSADGAKYQTIGTVRSNNLPAGSSYRYNDDSPLIGQNYYRLNMSDKDGSSVYSNTVQTTNRCEAILLWPNPVKEYLTVSGFQEGEKKVTIYNLTGQIVRTQVANGSAFRVNVQGLPSDSYIIRITDEKGLILKRTISKY